MLISWMLSWGIYQHGWSHRVLSVCGGEPGLVVSPPVLPCLCGRLPSFEHLTLYKEPGEAHGMGNKKGGLVFSPYLGHSWHGGRKICRGGGGDLIHLWKSGMQSPLR